jgi:starch synthase
MRVLFASNELTGLYKLGGLGDVAASLTSSLHSLGIDIRLAVPYHPEIKKLQTVLQDSFKVTYDHRRLQINVHITHLPGNPVPLYLFKEDTYLSRNTDASDNHADKYAVFSLAVAHWLNRSKYWQPQVIHLNEWHTSLIPIVIKHLIKPKQSYKFILSLHNLAYQANTSTPVTQKLGLPNGACHIIDQDKKDTFINILYEGIAHSDWLTTVSPSYAKEILDPIFGYELSQILNDRKDRLTGILNGIDTSFFDPKRDLLIKTTYNSDDVIEGKTANKKALAAQFGFNSDFSLICFVGRVDTKQKGIDIIISALTSGSFPPKDTHFIFLGTGDQVAESALHQINKQNTTILTRFDETLAHQLYASSDLIIIPSHFEPCGLIQMIALRYGTLPVAHATGGLKDTINEKCGFLYQPNSTSQFQSTLNTALNTLSNKSVKVNMIKYAMEINFSWQKSASKYIKLYENLQEL